MPVQNVTSTPTYFIFLTHKFSNMLMTMVMMIIIYLNSHTTINVISNSSSKIILAIVFYNAIVHIELEGK
jgi:hypothetical protein